MDQEFMSRNIFELEEEGYFIDEYKFEDEFKKKSIKEFVLPFDMERYKEILFKLDGVLIENEDIVYIERYGKELTVKTAAWLRDYEINDDEKGLKKHPFYEEMIKFINKNKITKEEALDFSFYFYLEEHKNLSDEVKSIIAFFYPESFRVKLKELSKGLTYQVGINVYLKAFIEELCDEKDIFDYCYDKSENLYLYAKDMSKESIVEWNKILDYGLGGSVGYARLNSYAKTDEDKIKAFKIVVTLMKLGMDFRWGVRGVFENAYQLNIINERYIVYHIFNYKEARDAYGTYENSDGKVSNIYENIILKIAKDSKLFYLERGIQNDYFKYGTRGADIFVKALEAIKNINNRKLKEKQIKETKKDRLNGLMRIIDDTWRAKENPKEDFLKHIENADVNRNDLIIFALRNIEWATIVSEYLNIPDLREIHWFIYDHEIKDQYNRTQEEELREFGGRTITNAELGNFDLRWYKELFGKLSKEDYELILEEIKKHRLKKLIDATEGRAELEDLKEVVLNKRNKEVLLAYSLIPLKDKKDLFERYNFIKKFLRESKQFGPMRRASEKKYSEFALGLLALNGGYDNLTRFNWNVEAKIFEEFRGYLEPKNIEGTELYIEILDYGKIDIKIIKNGKAQKTIPSYLKDNEYVKQLKEFKKHLKSQYKNDAKAFEHEMIEESEFTVEELKTISINPVTKFIKEKIIFINDEYTGYFDGEVFIDKEKGKITLDESVSLRVAHTLDLHDRDVIDYYKKLFKSKKSKQPFEQINRKFFIMKEEFIKDKYYYVEWVGKPMPLKTYEFALRGKGWYQDYKQDDYRRFEKQDSVAHLFADCTSLDEADSGIIRTKELTFMSFKREIHVDIRTVPRIPFSETIRDLDYVTSLEIVK